MLLVAALNFTATVMALMAAAWMLTAPDTPGRRSFAWTQLAIAWWAGTAGLEVLLFGDRLAVRIGQLQYLGIASLPVFWIHFAATYARRPVARTRWLLLTTLVPLVTVTLALTHGRQAWLWTDVRPPSAPGALTLEFVRGPWFWVNWTHTYVLLAVSTWWLVRALVRDHKAYAAQTALFLFGLAVPWAANVITVAGWLPWPGLDLTPSAFAITGACFVLALIWNRRSAPRPIP